MSSLLDTGGSPSRPCTWGHPWDTLGTPHGTLKQCKTAKTAVLRERQGARAVHMTDMPECAIYGTLGHIWPDVAHLVPFSDI